jgi:hypothetical protein
VFTRSITGARPELICAFRADRRALRQPAGRQNAARLPRVVPEQRQSAVALQGVAQQNEAEQQNAVPLQGVAAAAYWLDVSSSLNAARTPALRRFAAQQWDPASSA